MNNSDLRINTYFNPGTPPHLASMPRGVQVTHIPSGFVVIVQSELSQIKNVEKAKQLIAEELEKKKIKRNNQ